MYQGYNSIFFLPRPWVYKNSWRSYRGAPYSRLNQQLISNRYLTEQATFLLETLFTELINRLNSCWLFSGWLTNQLSYCERFIRSAHSSDIESTKSHRLHNTSTVAACQLSESMAPAAKKVSKFDSFSIAFIVFLFL